MISGVFVLHKHEVHFRRFSTRQVIRMELVPRLYILVSFSTSLLLIDIVLRSLWAIEKGWGGDSTWQFRWLPFHIGGALLAWFVHGTVDLILTNMNDSEGNVIWIHVLKQDSKKPKPDIESWITPTDGEMSNE